MKKEIIFILTFLITVSTQVFASETLEKYAETQECTLTFKNRLSNRTSYSKALLKESNGHLVSHSFGIQSSNGATAVLSLIPGEAGDYYEMTVEGAVSAVQKTGLTEGKTYTAGPMFQNGMKYQVFNSNKIKIECQTTRLDD
jgi:hypothetical protein